MSFDMSWLICLRIPFPEVFAWSIPQVPFAFMCFYHIAGAGISWVVHHRHRRRSHEVGASFGATAADAVGNSRPQISRSDPKISKMDGYQNWPVGPIGTPMIHPNMGCCQPAISLNSRGWASRNWMEFIWFPWCWPMIGLQGLCVVQGRQWSMVICTQENPMYING